MPVITGSVGTGAAFPTQKGAGGPLGVVTPNGKGSLYVDTTNGGLHIAVGVTNADWLAVGGRALFAESGVTGYVSNTHRNTLLLGERLAGLSDVAAEAGSGNGVSWLLHAADGDQTFEGSFGSGGSKTVVFADANGTIGPGDGGVKFPTADPHVAGAWWDNAGVLTKSAG